MAKRFYKHKLLLDENVHYRSYFPILNSLFNLKHITENFHEVGLSDPQIFKFAIATGRIIITFNFKDFEELVKTSNKTGVIGISSNLPVEIIDKKLTVLFRKASIKSLLGKLTIVSGESEN